MRSPNAEFAKPMHPDATLSKILGDGDLPRSEPIKRSNKTPLKLINSERVLGEFIKPEPRVKDAPAQVYKILTRHFSLSNNPLSASAYLELGKSLEASGFLEQAGTFYDGGLEIEPSNRDLQLATNSLRSRIRIAQIIGEEKIGDDRYSIWVKFRYPKKP
jgi:hypothetical protein